MSLHLHSLVREPTLSSETAAGGAVYAAVAAALSGCHFANNTANDAGAVALAGASAIDNCTFAGNVCAGSGGAVQMFAPDDTVTIANSVFTDNYAGGQVSLHKKLHTATWFAVVVARLRGPAASPS
jgi:predicted outer membrane repeat protein